MMRHEPLLGQLHMGLRDFSFSSEWAMLVNETDWVYSLDEIFFGFTDCFLVPWDKHFCSSWTYLNRSGPLGGPLAAPFFQMLSGTSPFKDTSEWLIFQRIIARDIRFPNYFSDAARDLIDRLLVCYMHFSACYLLPSCRHALIALSGFPCWLLFFFCCMCTLSFSFPVYYISVINSKKKKQSNSVLLVLIICGLWAKLYSIKGYASHASWHIWFIMVVGNANNASV